MGLKSKVFPNSYRDSVLLMKMAGMVRKIEGVENAEVIIATEANKGILEFNGLLTEEIKRATPNDLVVSVIAGDEAVIEKAIAAVEDMIFNGLEDDKGGKVTYSAKSIAGALAMEPEADLAILSIPGPLVKKDAMKLLDSGVNLLIFSDNVPIEDELELKRKADEKGLMVMGPDCGTAIVRGASLAFANKVRQGKIGMVCASGTGLQEVAVLIHNLGQGISHALGTGSNDVKDVIGGISMKRGLKWLEQDGSTELIVVVSKPPQKATMENLKEEFKKCRKPVIVNFLGSSQPVKRDGNVYYTDTLEETALKALELAGETVDDSVAVPEDILEDIRRERELHRHKGGYMRALYTGGTLGTEAAIICRDILSGLTTNLTVPGVEKMADYNVSTKNCILDLGADEFTLGKPHPMIEPEMKNQRLLKEAADLDTAVILLDFVLGHGVNADPAGNTLYEIDKAREIADSQGRHITFVASVTGTDEDPQNREEQIRVLKDHGVLVLPSNAQAVRAAVEIVKECR